MTADRDYLFKLLRMVWTEHFGDARPVRAEERIDQWLKEEGHWEDFLEFVTVLIRLEKALGDQITMREMADFWSGGQKSLENWEAEVAPQLTFGKFVDWMVAKNLNPYRLEPGLEPAKFAPVTIAGKVCAPAGAFFGLRELAAQVNSWIPQFGPSSRIADFIKGPARGPFWRGLRFHTDNAVPPLHGYTEKWWMRALFLIVYLCGAIAGCAWILNAIAQVQAVIVAMPIYLLLLAFVTLLAFASVDVTYGGTLPEGIETFRDLANHIAEKQQLTTDN